MAAIRNDLQREARINFWVRARIKSKGRPEAMDDRSDVGGGGRVDVGPESMNRTRRRILVDAARLAAAELAYSFLTPNLGRAAAQSTPPGSWKQIKHVVLLMQENRSFDHYFGTMAGVRGFGDPQALKLVHGKSVFHQPDKKSPSGIILPFHLDTQKTGAQKIPETNHFWDAQHGSWNGGKMDNWMPIHRACDKEDAPFVMGYYKRADIPFHFALAEAFTVCDAYHCSVLGSTWPNRMYWMTGTIDPEGRHGGPMIYNDESKKGLTWTTYAERLTKAGVSWKVYHQNDSFGTNIFWQFKSFRDAPSKSTLHRCALTPGPADQFESDVKQDKLPTVSWLLPTGEECEAPNHWPAAGAAFIARRIEAIASNPDVWNKTVFILNYDENDGLFDHVPPPTPPPGTPGEYVHQLPIGAGFRVPCIIVSPWTAGGWVAQERYDHTSVLRFLEKITGVREPNISDWRRKTFGDLTSAFRRQREGSPPKLPNAHALLAKAKDQFEGLPSPSAPGTAESIPVQEQSKNPVVGEWRLKQPSLNNSTLHIREVAGKLEVQEKGNGNAKSTTASYKDGLLVVHWATESGKTRGYWVLNLNNEVTKGTGKTVFTQYSKDFEAGKEQLLQDRTVRVETGVTIERIRD